MVLKNLLPFLLVVLKINFNANQNISERRRHAGGDTQPIYVIYAVYAIYKDMHPLADGITF